MNGVTVRAFALTFNLDLREKSISDQEKRDSKKLKSVDNDQLTISKINPAFGLDLKVVGNQEN